MQHLLDDLEYAEYLFERFYSPGSTESGGVTRLGYTDTEDEMIRIFTQLGEEKGYQSYTDEVGNSFLKRASDDGKQPYVLIGSHLDSVIDGGRYDGVVGVIAGLLLLRWCDAMQLTLPVRVAALRCEESSNFSRSTIGSGLITKEVYKNDIGEAIGKDGRPLREVFAERGYSLNPSQIQGVRSYLELHIEQGRVLEEYGDRVGIVTTIAGPRRFNIHIHGMAEHSGTTPMPMRTDALCAAAEIILEIERIGREESVYQSVATVGTVKNIPNALNVIPGGVELGVDMRGVDVQSLDRMEEQLKLACRRICAERGATYFREKTSDIPPIGMSPVLQDKLLNAAKALRIPHKSMMSGAGHDAMSFAHICDTAMVFIPCKGGVSHNKGEFTTIESILDGAMVLFEYLKGEAQ